MESPADRCGYMYAGESGHENCCYRETWRDADRCIWHEQAATDEIKPVETLIETRTPQQIREQTRGPAELLDGATIREISFPDGMDFADCSLRDADMAEVTLRDGTLAGADLTDARLVDADLRRSDLTGTNCWEAEMTDINLEDASLRGADLRTADCSDAVLRGADLHGANIEGVFFNRANLFDTTLTRTRSYGAVFSDARANEGTDLDELCVYDPKSEADPTDWDSPGTVLDTDDEIDPLTKAEGTYQELENLCAENALLNAQGRYFVRRQDIHTTEHRNEGNWSRWIRARVSRAVVLYGESPFRVLSVTAAIIVGSALLYPLGLLRSSKTGEVLTYPPLTEPVALLQTFADSLYFSTLTFTTMTFGLYAPVGPGKFLTMFETSAGIVLMALLVFVFGRRATR